MGRELHTDCRFFNCANIESKNDIFLFLQKIIDVTQNFTLKYELWDRNKEIRIGYKTILNSEDLEEVFNQAYYHMSTKEDTKNWIDAPNAGISFDFFHKNENKRFSYFKVHIYEVKKYSEISFGASWYPKGEYNEIYFKLERRFQDLLTLSKEIYNLALPLYGYIGEMIPPFTGIVRKLIQEDNKLPVINWVNYFGPQYVEKYGEEFLLNALGYKKEKLEDGGVFLQLSPHFLIFDNKETIPGEEIVNYFTQHPKIKKIKYQPLFAEEVLPKKYIENPPEKESEPQKDDISNKLTYTPETLRKLAKDIVKTSKKNLEIKLNFKPKSLKKLDEAISKCFDSNNPPHPVVILDFGAYLGEVIIRNLGGNWEIAENPMESEIIGLPNIASLRPIVKMAKRFENGSEDSIIIWYESIQRRVKEKK